MSAHNNIYLLSYAFNQDSSCFVCGTTSGFRVFRTSPLSEIMRQESSPAFQHRSVALVSMLYQSSLFAMVTSCTGELGGAEHRTVQIWDESKRKFVGEVRSRNEVKGVVMRRDIIAMVCESSINVYSLDRLKHMLNLTTYENPKGLCASAPATKPWILCCPGPSKGAVRVQTGADDAQVFQAHETELAVLALNEEGTRIATASEFGTVVKVFQRSDLQLLYRLRVSSPAQGEVISSIAFRPDDCFLAVAVSSAATVHIFKTPTAGDVGKQDVASPSCPLQEEPFGSMASIGDDARRVRGISSLLTGAVKGAMPAYFSDSWSCARFKLPDVDPTFDARSSCAQISGPLLAFHKSEPTVYVLHHSGMMYETRFQPADCSQGCTLQSAATWFQVRPDFKIRDSQQATAVVVGELGEQSEDGADEWQVL